MKIINNKTESKELQVGDIVEFDDGVTGLIIEIEPEDCEHVTKDGFGCLLLTHLSEDCFSLRFSGYIKDLDAGNYKILAHADDWNIVID